MQSSSPLRLFPIVIFAILIVFGFKLANYALVSDPSAIASAQAQETSDADAAAVPEEVIDPEASGDYTAVDAEEAAVVEENSTPYVFSETEQDVLESLQERREALDAREEEIALRERLLQATELRVEQRVAELKEIEAQIEASFGRQAEEQREQLQNLVGLYENMKPKDAARIFDRLDMAVLIGVVEQMPARRMAPIMAKMDPAVAERLTVELAARASDRASGIDVPPLSE
jgi:flagellar motility protein MotE (MotC chaperone)